MNLQINVAKLKAKDLATFINRIDFLNGDSLDLKKIFDHEIVYLGSNV